MNGKKQVPKLMSILLSFAMIFNILLPATAIENILDGSGWTVDEENFEDISVTYQQASSFFVTIPKTIALDTGKQSTYSVRVSGDIDPDKCVYVAPIDDISDTDNTDFYMQDQNHKKEDVVATITHNKIYWNHEEVAAGYEETDNFVAAEGLSAGIWKGTFQTEICMMTDPNHTHSYTEKITKQPTCTEKGEKTYTCICGHSYTEEIPAKGHNYEHGECTDCGEKDPNHTHSYTEKITKQPTCTEKGEKTYTCICGHNYTEEIPAKGHNYEDGKCTDCGETDPSHTHSYDEGVVTKEPTCTEKGEKTFTCICGDSYTEEIPATGHNYEDGKCTICGEIDPNHTHSYDEGVVTKDPTCTERGEKTLTCSECGHSYIEDVGALGHDHIQRNNWENTSNGGYAFVQQGTKWTSNNNGVQSSTATSTWTITLDEDTEYSFKYKVSSEDKYDKLTITLDSTTIANAISGAGTEITYTNTLTAGTHTLIATYAKDSSQNKNDDCGYLILEEISKELVEIKEPTCTEPGEKVYTCARCGMTYSEVIPATGHNYENGKCTNCGEIDPDHVHTYEPYEVIIKPELTSSKTSGSIPTSSYQYTKWMITNSAKEGYSDFYVQCKCASGSTGAQFNATLEVTLPDDFEGVYNWKYYYISRYNSNVANSATSLRVNGTVVHRDTYGYSTSDITNDNVIHTISLHAGKNTVTLQANFYGAKDDTYYNWYDVYFEDIVLYDGTEYHICNECRTIEEHTFEGTVTKKATCVEEGEMTYTCAECGYSYTEVIPTNGGHHYDDDDVCVDCGHTHTYEPYKFTVEPKLVSSTKTNAPSNTAKYDIWAKGSLNEGYSDFYVKSICLGGSTGAQFNAKIEITLPDDYEGEYNYQYYYTSFLACRDQGAAERLLLNNNMIHRYSYGQVVSAIGTDNTISKIPMHAGKNTITLEAHFYNAAGNTNPDDYYYNGYSVYLEEFSLFDGSQYHICNECGKKDEHHYVNGICVQCGWKEGEHEHHYVDGFCDKCGKDETQYNLIFDDSKFLNDVTVTSSTKKIRNGDIVELPERSDDAYNFEGYSIIRPVENVELCSQNVKGGVYAICTQQGGPSRFSAWSTPSYEYEFGVQTEWVDPPNVGGGGYNSVLTDYFWKQTAESDIITIDKPMIFAFNAYEDITDGNIYSADSCSSGSMKFEDITRNTTYGLISASSSGERDGSVKVHAKSSYTNNSTSSSTRAYKYTRNFTIYLQPGQYKLSASGKSGDGSVYGASSHYWLYMSSPLSGASKTLAAPVINGVHHTAFGGTLYEVIPIEDGVEFDFSTMYSVKSNKNIYLISNWSKKEAE